VLRDLYAGRTPQIHTHTNTHACKVSDALCPMLTIFVESKIIFKLGQEKTN